MAKAPTRERPMLFSGKMVRAILDGRKAQSRRTVKVGNSLVDGLSWNAAEFTELAFLSPLVSVEEGPSPRGNRGPYLQVPRHPGNDMHKVYPAWRPGDRLWVRETWSVDADIYQVERELKDTKRGLKHGPYFRADPGHEDSGLTWRQGIHLPRWASRVTLEITGTRVERLQDISAADCIAEGVGIPRSDTAVQSTRLNPRHLRHEYRQLWEKINGAGSWDRNPWVCVLEIKRVKR